MLGPVEALLLGALQGVTEWLPISSSGHLVIVQSALGLTLPLLFDALLHLGTLAVVLAYLHKDVGKILRSVARLDFKSDDGRYIPLVIVGTLPTTLIVIFFRTYIEPLFYNPQAVAVAYIVSAPFLFYTRPNYKRERLTYSDAFIIGVFQGVAIIPGISRSGATIGIGLMRGLNVETSAKYSFLLSTPAILGAVGLEARGMQSSDPSLIFYFMGTMTSIIVGYLSLKFLLRTLKSGRFHLFAFYCATIGTLVLLASYYTIH